MIRLLLSLSWTLLPPPRRHGTPRAAWELLPPSSSSSPAPLQSPPPSASSGSEISGTWRRTHRDPDPSGLKELSMFGLSEAATSQRPDWSEMFWSSPEVLLQVHHHHAEQLPRVAALLLLQPGGEAGSGRAVVPLRLLQGRREEHGEHLISGLVQEDCPRPRINHLLNITWA